MLKSKLKNYNIDLLSKELQTFKKECYFNKIQFISILDGKTFKDELDININRYKYKLDRILGKSGSLIKTSYSAAEWNIRKGQNIGLIYSFNYRNLEDIYKLILIALTREVSFINEKQFKLKGQLGVNKKQSLAFIWINTPNERITNIIRQNFHKLNSKDSTYTKNYTNEIRKLRELEFGFNINIFIKNNRLLNYLLLVPSNI